MNYLVFAAVALVIPSLIIGSSFLIESERYVLILDESESGNDAYIEFYPINSKKNFQVIADEGFVMIEGEEYNIVEDWKGSFIDDDKLFFMAGSVENFDEKINVFVMGKFLGKTIDGSLYDVVVHIHSEQPVEFQSTGEIIGISPTDSTNEIKKEPINEIKNEEPIDILFLIQDTHHRFQDQEYVFTTKLYDKKQNPLGEWNVKGGELSNAEITVEIVDLDGNSLRKIQGTTNEFGWFEGKFPIGTTFPRGEYLVLYTAKYQDNMADVQKPFYVFEVQSHASTRHFLPTSDISRGKWSDNTGNQNQLMFDDLDEYNPLLGPYSSVDNTDYVHSKNLGKKDSFDSDTFHVRITTNGGVTADHDHTVLYALGKDDVGGSDINFTVTLFDGTREVAIWTHSSVANGFSLIENTLTREQVKSISNYNNLSLNFTAWCDPCLGGNDKRDGQVSWIHMIV